MTYSQWASYITTRRAVASDVTIEQTGEYSIGTRTGQVHVVVSNAGASAINANLYLVLTEDSVYYSAPNGDPWHNHVCRDYLPSQSGTALALAAGGSDTVTQAFSVPSDTWDLAKLKITAYLQSTTLQADSSKVTYQGGNANVSDFVGVAEYKPVPSVYKHLAVQANPNPCRTSAEFRFQGLAGDNYTLGVYSLDGSLVRQLKGPAGSDVTRAVWDRTDAAGRFVPRGVYGYRLNIGGFSTSGKLVVAD
jgi:hypothetical protein